jgi:flagellar biosynthesis protein FliP
MTMRPTSSQPQTDKPAEESWTERVQRILRKIFGRGEEGEGRKELDAGSDNQLQTEAMPMQVTVSALVLYYLKSKSEMALQIIIPFVWNDRI